MVAGNNTAELAPILRSLASEDVASCTSYVLFPLLMLLDMETSPLLEEARAGGEENNEDDESVAPGGGGSNAVLEAVLTCVQCILTHARKTSRYGGTVGSSPAEATPLVASVLPRLVAVLTWPAVSEDACILAISSLDQLLLVSEQDAPAPSQGVALSAQSRAFFGGKEGAAHFGHLCSALLQVVNLYGVWVRKVVGTIACRRKLLLLFGLWTTGGDETDSFDTWG